MEDKPCMSKSLNFRTEANTQFGYGDCEYRGSDSTCSSRRSYEGAVVQTQPSPFGIYPHCHTDSMNSICESNYAQEDSCMLLQIEPSELLGQDAAPVNVQPLRRETLKGYKLGSCIGRGGFSQVLVGVHKLSGRKVAVKVIEKSMLLKPQDHTRIKLEVTALQLLHHTNVLRLLEVVDLPHQLYMVTEYVPDGSLLDLLKQSGPLPEHRAAKYLAQVVLALMHCHEQGIVHRDIKLENLLFDQKMDQVKIVDFGLCGIHQRGRLLSTCCGTASYAAPEVHRRQKYGPEVDIWSLGVVTYAMLCGQLPFTDPDKTLKIIQGEFEEPKGISKCAVNLLRKMLCTDRSSRISLQGILDHPWVRPLILKGVLNDEVFQYDLARDPHEGFACPLPAIINLQERYGFDGSEVRRDLTESKYSGGSAAYFLLLHNLWDKQRRIAHDSGMHAQGGYKLNIGNFCVEPIGHVRRDDSARIVQTSHVYCQNAPARQVQCGKE
eukprot:TRINITY_DN8426_c0_g1_i10.p1 TRINITY_DN8426_c0_g1~~TRINITY_DN8426_c0_g1_i10.p1  ORF type:complete len:492 (+),score=34.78 TRINITY_DN8426_c0_g1_i10:257-1732(+)